MWAVQCFNEALQECRTYSIRSHSDGQHSTATTKLMVCISTFSITSTLVRQWGTGAACVLIASSFTNVSSEYMQEDDLREESLVFNTDFFFPVIWLPEVKVITREVKEDEAERATVSPEGTWWSGWAGDDFSVSLWDSDGCDRHTYKKKKKVRKGQI